MFYLRPRRASIQGRCLPSSGLKEATRRRMMLPDRGFLTGRSGLWEDRAVACGVPRWFPRQPLTWLFGGEKTIREKLQRGAAQLPSNVAGRLVSLLNHLSICFHHHLSLSRSLSLPLYPYLTLSLSTISQPSSSKLTHSLTFTLYMSSKVPLFCVVTLLTKNKISFNFGKKNYPENYLKRKTGSNYFCH